MKFLAHAACGIALVATSVPSLAQDEVPRAVISYHDLDLAKEEGVTTLGLRVKRAIRRLCRADGRSLWDQLQQRRCVKQATLDADRQMAKAIQKARPAADRPAALITQRTLPRARVGAGHFLPRTEQVAGGKPTQP
jgi:UrcA family protein